MASMSRVFLIRRPPLVSCLDEPFVPELTPAQRDEVEWRWAALCRENPAYFDGRLLHVFGVHRNGAGGAIIHAAECAYRYHAVHDDAFDTGTRPLGVKGVVERDGRFLLGRRGAAVANYVGEWEFAPGGVVEPGESPERTIVRELEEETGAPARGAPIPLAVLYDDVLHCWEIVYRLELDGEPWASCAEYDAFAWRALSDLPAPMTPIARRIAALFPASGD